MEYSLLIIIAEHWIWKGETDFGTRTFSLTHHYETGPYGSKNVFDGDHSTKWIASRGGTKTLESYFNVKAKFSLYYSIDSIQ